MRVAVEDLSREGSIEFPSGIKAYISAALGGESKEGSLKIRIGTSDITLSEAIEIRNKQCYFIYGQNPHLLTIAGGPNIYTIADDGTCTHTIRTKRCYDFENLWLTVVKLVDEAVLVVYEEDILLLDSQLDVKWHKNKRWLDMFVDVEEDGLRAVFLDDNNDLHYLSIATGQELSS